MDIIEVINLIKLPIFVLTSLLLSIILILLAYFGIIKNLVNLPLSFFLDLKTCFEHFVPSPAQIPHSSSCSGDPRILSQPTSIHSP